MGVATQTLQPVGCSEETKIKTTQAEACATGTAKSSNLQNSYESNVLRGGLRAGTHLFARFRLAEAEGPVQRLDGFLHAARFHQEGDVVLRGTLRNGDHIDSFIAQCAENAPGDAGSPGHVFSDRCDDGHVSIDGHMLEFVVVHVLIQRVRSGFSVRNGSAG